MATLRQLIKLGKLEAEKKEISTPGIGKEEEKERLAAQIKGGLDATARNIPELAGRELGAVVAGERIPMDHPQQDATEEESLWFTACHSLESGSGYFNRS